MTDIYKAPESRLTESASVEGFGSLEIGVSGQYQFSIRAVIKEAWAKTRGAKGSVWVAFIVYLLILVPVSLGIPYVLTVIGLPNEMVPGQVPSPAVVGGFVTAQILIMLISLPLSAGIFMLGLKLASGIPVSAMEVVRYYHKALPIFFTLFLMYLMILIGFILLIIPGIYLMIAYYMAIPLVVEKGLSPWQALEASRKALSKHWFRFLGFGMAILLIMILSILPLGIGFIWTMPMAIIAYGIVYRNIFGFDEAIKA